MLIGFLSDFDRFQYYFEYGLFYDFECGHAYDVECRLLYDFECRHLYSFECGYLYAYECAAETMDLQPFFSHVPFSCFFLSNILFFWIIRIPPCFSDVPFFRMYFLS